MGVKTMCVKAKDSVKQFVKRNPKELIYASSASVIGTIASAASLGAFAEELPLSNWVNSSLSTGLTSAADNFTSYANTAVPIGLGIFAAVFGISYAMKLFKRVSK